MTRPRPKALKTTRTEAEVLPQVQEAAQSCGVILQRRNTGGFVNPQGQYVACGEPGDSDLIGVIPRGPNEGRALVVECKAEGFDPSKLTGKKKAHFERQLAKLQQANADGGFGVWVDDAGEFLEILRHVLAGARVEEPGVGRPVVIYPRRGGNDDG